MVYSGHTSSLPNLVYSKWVAGDKAAMLADFVRRGVAQHLIDQEGLRIRRAAQSGASLANTPLNAREALAYPGGRVVQDRLLHWYVRAVLTVHNDLMITRLLVPSSSLIRGSHIP
jgi:hypothetical protein